MDNVSGGVFFMYSVSELDLDVFQNKSGHKKTAQWYMSGF